mgnify:CR=1 FL=1
MTADRNPLGCCQPMRFDSSNLHFFRIGQCLTSQGSSDRPSGNSQYDSCRIHHLNFANCRGSFFAKYWRCIMARLTLEDLRADPLVKPDFDILKKIGLSENEPWEFVCKMLDFCDDEYFNLKAKSMFTVYISGYFSCFHKFNLETIKEVFK